MLMKLTRGLCQMELTFLLFYSEEKGGGGRMVKTSKEIIQHNEAKKAYNRQNKTRENEIDQRFPTVVT
jgi:hypothetical protein